MMEKLRISSMEHAVSFTASRDAKGRLSPEWRY
jgi:hypothetical protein